MSHAEREREQLHDFLDDILDAKEVLKAASDRSDTEEAPNDLRKDATNIFAGSAKLLSLIVDDYISEVAFGAFPDSDDFDQNRWDAIDGLHEKLAYLTKVLGAPDWHWWIENILDELWLLKFGDKPDLLKPAETNQGRKSQPGRKAFLGLQALQWRAYFIAMGIEDLEIIYKAYDCPWENMRKWEKSFRDVLGDDQVDRRLIAATQSDWLKPDFVEIDEIGRIMLSAAGKAELEAEGAIFQECRHLEAGKKQKR